MPLFFFGGTHHLHRKNKINTHFRSNVRSFLINHVLYTFQEYIYFIKSMKFNMKTYLFVLVLLILDLWPFVMAEKERKLRRISLNDGEIILLKIQK